MKFQQVYLKIFFLNPFLLFSINQNLGSLILVTSGFGSEVRSMAIDQRNGIIYGEGANNRIIKRYNVTSNQLMNFAGNGVQSSTDGPLLSSSFSGFDGNS